MSTTAENPEEGRDQPTAEFMVADLTQPGWRHVSYVRLLAALTASGLGVDRDSSIGYVGNVPALLANRFAQKYIVALFHQSRVWPVHRANSPGTDEKATAHHKNPAAIAHPHILKIKFSLAARLPGRRG